MQLKTFSGFFCFFIYFLVVVCLFLALHALLGPLQRCTDGQKGRGREKGRDDGKLDIFDTWL
jgi:hypothetical protein